MNREGPSEATPLWLAQGEHHVPDGDEWLTAWERERLGPMRYTKRLVESRMARWTIKQTIAGALALPQAGNGELSRLRIVNLPSGAPVAEVDGEPDLSVSMTDRAGWAVGVVLRSPVAIGCDLELVEPRSDAFVADYFTETEQHTVANAPHPRSVTANLIWSAKESALKVLRTGLRRDTRSVEVDVAFEPNDGWQPLRIRPSEGGSIHGWWIRHADFLLTFAAATRTPPPESIVEPSPLATARPSHGWMQHPLTTDP